MMSEKLMNHKRTSFLSNMVQFLTSNGLLFMTVYEEMMSSEKYCNHLSMVFRIIVKVNAKYD